MSWHWHLAFGIHGFGIWRLALGIWHLAFGHSYMRIDARRTANGVNSGSKEVKGLCWNRKSHLSVRCFLVQSPLSIWIAIVVSFLSLPGHVFFCFVCRCFCFSFLCSLTIYTERTPRTRPQQHHRASLNWQTATRHGQYQYGGGTRDEFCSLATLTRLFIVRLFMNPNRRWW